MYTRKDVTAMGLTYKEKTAWLILELPLFECTCDTYLGTAFQLILADV